MNKHGSGYGILRANNGQEYSGYLGSNTDITLAELTAIYICTCEIAATDIGNSTIEIFSDSLGALKALSKIQ